VSGDRGRRPRFGDATGNPTDTGHPTVVVDAASGALVVHTPPRLHRAALEIHAAGTPWAGTHTAVHERREDERVHFEGVFSRLDPGAYELRVLGSATGVVVPIVIRPGVVAETWLDAPVD